MNDPQTSALEKERRTTERVMVKIPIRVLCFGGSAGDFTEDTYTIHVNAAGALIALEHPVAPDDTIRIIDLENYREADFRVIAPAGQQEAGKRFWGVECAEPGRILWDIDFGAPLAADHSQAGALLACQGCGRQSFQVLSLTEVDILETAGGLRLPCDPCGQVTAWVYAEVVRSPQPPPPSQPLLLEMPPQSAPPPVEDWDGQAERRLHRRVALKLPVLVRNGKGEEEVSKTENLSKTGLAVGLKMSLTVGEFLTVVCPYSPDEARIEQRAEVRRRIASMGSGKWLYGLRYAPK